MITTFESFGYYFDKYQNTYMTGKRSFRIDHLYYYLGVEVEYPEDAVVVPVTKYGVDFIDFCKEIFLGKKIAFQSLNKPKDNPVIDGVVEDVDQLAYQDEFFVRVKIRKEWYLISNLQPIFIENYDASEKPLHKEVVLKKEAEKYNL
jgi:hypothetical protein